VNKKFRPQNKSKLHKDQELACRKTMNTKEGIKLFVHGTIANRRKIYAAKNRLHKEQKFSTQNKSKYKEGTKFSIYGTSHDYRGKN
jgi:hypothetical protein